MLDLIGALARHHGDEARISLSMLEDNLFGSVPWLFGLVAEEEGSLIGYALLCRVCRAQFGERGIDLHHLFVVDRARGRGIGRLIVEAALEEARTLGCTYFVVGANAQNHAAQRFYERIGFRRTFQSGPRFKLQLGTADRLHS